MNSPVSPEAGRAVVITGASRSGKTTLCLALLERGFAFLSDDTLPVTRDGRAVPYLRPVNVREPTLRTLPQLRDWIAAAARAVETPIGTTHMVAAHKLPYPVGVESEIICTVRLASADGDLQVRHSAGRVAITGDVTRHLSRAVDEVERGCLSVAAG